MVTSSLSTLVLSVLVGRRGKTLAREMVVVLLSARYVEVETETPRLYFYPISLGGWILAVGRVSQLGSWVWAEGCSGGLCQGNPVVW